MNSKNQVERFLEETCRRHEVATGPLWRVTVMPTEKMADPTNTLQDFPHQYQLLIGFHHGITDGHSSMRICGHLLSLLNDVVEGKQDINDEVQLAEFSDDKHTNEIREECLESLKNDAQIYAKLTDKANYYSNHKSLLFDLYSGSPPERRTTEYLYTTVDKAVAYTFISKAKVHCVSVHSAISTAIHSAIIELFIEKDVPDKEFAISSLHDTNFRRYWKTDGKKVYGPHVGPNRVTVKLPKNMMCNFWFHAQEFHSSFQAQLKDKEAILFQVLSSLHGQEIEQPSDIISQFQVPYTPFTYGISNMGDVSKFFRKTDGCNYSHAQIVDIQRCTDIPPNIIYPSTFAIQTLNGNILISFFYQTQYFTKLVAQTLLDHIVRVVKSIHENS